MANRYWVGNGGNWNDTTHWALSAGETGGESVPTAEDNVYFDEYSFTADGESVFVPTGSPGYDCLSLECSGASKNFYLQGGESPDNWSSLNVYGNATLNNKISITGNGSSSGMWFNLYGTGILSQNGAVFGANVWVYSGGTSTLGSDLILTEGLDVDPDTGSFTTNNYNIVAPSHIEFYSGDIYLGSSTLETTEIYNESEGIFDAGTSTIIIELTDEKINYFEMWYVNLYDVIIKNTAKLIDASFQFDVLHNTFNSITFLDPPYTVEFNTYQDWGTMLCNAFIANGEPGNFFTFDSNNVTLSVPTYIVEVYRCSLSNLPAIGGATFNAINCENVEGNTGWTFITAITELYWVGGTGYWDDPTYWALTSGGVNGLYCPDMFTSVIIDSNSGFDSGGTIYETGDDTQCYNFTSISGHNYRIEYINSDIEIYGSAVFEAGIDWYNEGWTSTQFFGTGSHTIITNGCILFDVYIEGTGTFELLDNLTSRYGFYLNGSTFNSNNHTITAKDVGYNTYYGIATGNLGTSTITCWWFDLEGTTIDYSNVTIIYETPTYYWVGEGGNWNDWIHWALDSNGIEGFGGIPNRDEIAIFDEYSFTSPTAPKLLLNFEGVDGATTWVDEAQNTSININEGCEIDTAQFYSGISSLLIKLNSQGGCYVSNLGNNITYKTRFLYNEIDSGTYIYPIDISSNGLNDNSPNLGVAYYNEYWHFYLKDRTGVYQFDEIIPDVIFPNIWNNVKIVVQDRNISLYFNDILYNTWISNIENPLSGGNYCWWGNYSVAPTNNLWIDQIEWSSIPTLNFPLINQTSFLSIPGLDFSNIAYPISVTFTNGNAAYTNDMYIYGDLILKEGMKFSTISPEYECYLSPIGESVIDTNNVSLETLNISLNSYDENGMLYPGIGSYLILNFEGENGATTWTEESQGLSPDSINNIVIDTSQYYSGSSSLRFIAPDSDTQYTFPLTFNDSWIFKTSFRYTGTPHYMWPIFLGYYDTYPFIDFGYNDVELSGWNLAIRDYQGNFIVNYIQTGFPTLLPDVWHIVEITVENNNISFKIDDVEIGPWSANIDAPLRNLNKWWVGNYNTVGSDMWLDKVEWTSFPAPEGIQPPSTSSWNIISDLTCYNFETYTGTLNLNDITLTVKGEYLDIEPVTASDFDAGTSSIIMDLGYWDLDNGGGTYGNYVYIESDDMTPITMYDLTFQVTGVETLGIIGVYTYNNTAFHNIALLDPPYEIEFSSGETISCNDFITEESEDTTFTVSSDNPEYSPWTLNSNSEEINISNTILSNSIATGSCVFNSLLENGCLDDGGNGGWNFYTFLPREGYIRLLTDDIVRFNSVTIASPYVKN